LTVGRLFRDLLAADLPVSSAVLLGTLKCPVCRKRLVVLLVRIACFADTTLEVHAPALLHNVRDLVGRGVEIRRRRERNMVAGGECLCADRAGPHGCRRICVRLDISDVVAAQ
jgi:hypothetical protein